MFMARKKPHRGMSEDTIWSDLGSNLLLPSTLIKRVNELEEQVLHLVNVIASFEERLPNKEPIDPFDSTQFLDITEFIPTEDEDVRTEDIEIRVITDGFIAPSPESEMISVEKTAYSKYKSGEITWQDYVKVCNGVKRAVAIRDEVEGSTEEE